MPDQDSSRSNYYLNLVKNGIVNQVGSAILKIVDSSYPEEFRQQMAQEVSDQISHQVIQELKQTPNLDPESYQDAKELAIAKAIQREAEFNNKFNNLIPQKIRDQIASSIGENLTNEDAQNAAKAAAKKTPKPLDSEVLATQLLEGLESDFGIKPEQASQMLQHLRNQPDIINHPTPNRINQALKDLAAQSDKFGLNQVVVAQFANTLLKNTDQVHHYVQASTDPLPRTTPFTPFKPGVDAKTIRQANAMGVSPLALAYTKSGFSSADERLSKDLQTEVSRIHDLVSTPTDPTHQMGLSGHLSAATLKPQVFVAQKLYHPIYKAHQKSLIGANKILEHPFNFYTKVDGHYKDFTKAVSEFKQTNPLGWAIAPRMRFNNAVSSVKSKVKKDVKSWARSAKVKTPERRRRIARLRLARMKTKSFWNKWSPNGIRKRVGAWTIKQTGRSIAWLGKKLSIKFLTDLGGTILGTASGIGIPLVVLKFAFSFFKSTLRKLKEKREKESQYGDSAGAGAKALQTLLSTLKALSAALFGSLWGFAGSLLGAFIGTLILPGLGTVVGFFAGGLIGTSLGAIFGYNLPNIAAIVGSAGSAISGFFSSLSGTAAAATATSLTLVGIGGAIIPTALIIHQQQQTINSAFFLPFTPEDSFHQSPSSEENSSEKISYECALSDQPPPTPGSILFSDDGQYAFPVARSDYWLSCTHWGDASWATDIGFGVGMTGSDQVVGAPVIAYVSGVIGHVEFNHKNAGINFSIVGKDGRTYYYSHNCALYVQAGESVSVGQVVATTDKTGLNATTTPEHLHFEIYEGGNPVCAPEDLEAKFHLNKCSLAEQCNP